MLVDGDKRADDGQLVEHAGLARHVFANLHAGHVGLDRPKLAAILHGGVRLEVVHVHVRRAAGQVDHDGGLVGRASRAAPVSLAPRRRSMSARVKPGAERADLEEVAAIEPVAELLPGAEEIQHRVPLVDFHFGNGFVTRQAIKGRRPHGSRR